LGIAKVEITPVVYLNKKKNGIKHDTIIFDDLKAGEQ